MIKQDFRMRCSPLSNFHYFWTSQQQFCFSKIHKHLIFLLSDLTPLVKNQKTNLSLYRHEVQFFNFNIFSCFRPMFRRTVFVFNMFCHTGFTESYESLRERGRNLKTPDFDDFLTKTNYPYQRETGCCRFFMNTLNEKPYVIMES